MAMGARRPQGEWALSWATRGGFAAAAIALALAVGAYSAPYDVGPVNAPRLFAEGIVSSVDDEPGGAFSADGKEFYFAKLAPYTTYPRLGVLCVSHYRGGRWSAPEVLPFSGRYLDLPPRLSPDGRTMYFSSSRPAPGKTARTLRIWAVTRTDSGWGEPAPLPAPVNAPDDAANFGPSVTRDGTLYFASTRDSGKIHVFRAARANDGYAAPEELGPEINSAFNEAEPCVSPDEDVLVFTSSGNGLGEVDRATTLKSGGVPYARGDLYVSERVDGKWTPARHLEHGINSTADEGSPAFTPDGAYLFFGSERSHFTTPMPRRLTFAEYERALHGVLNGHGNVWFVSRAALGLGRSTAAR